MMNDAIVLLALSQVVCLGGLAYLYGRVEDLRRQARSSRRVTSGRVRHIDPFESSSPLIDHVTPRPPATAPMPPDLAVQIEALGVDIPAIARRMRRSEEEVRLLLRRQGVSQ
jgi:hypothetical protein